MVGLGKVVGVRMVMLGPPGSGKGTYASRLNAILEIPHISTGDIVREEIRKQTELGKRIKGYSDRGELVPDDMITQLLKIRLDRPDCSRGFILDGYPRTTRQAEALNRISRIDVVVNLNVPDEIIIQRLSNRLTCRRCGAIYNKLTLKPKVEGVCGECGGELYQREDDKPKVIQDRLDIYRKNTEPLTEHYTEKGLLRDVHCDDLMTPPEVIVEKILTIVNSARTKKDIR